MNRHVRRTKPVKRRSIGTERTRNDRGYRITASWDARPDRPAVRQTSDRKAARKTARGFADAGAYVIVEKHVRYGEFRTAYELDGPAIVAAREAEQAAEETRTRRIEQAAADRAARRRAQAEQQRTRTLAAVDTRALMAAPDTARRDPGRARHTAGGRR